MLRPSPNHGTQRLPNDDDDDPISADHASPPEARVVTCALRDGKSPSRFAAHKQTTIFPARLQRERQRRTCSGQWVDSDITVCSPFNITPLLFPIT